MIHPLASPLIATTLTTNEDEHWNCMICWRRLWGGRGKEWNVTGIMEMTRERKERVYSQI